MFERTLDNLVKGIRAHKSDAGTYVSNEIQCIKGNDEDILGSEVKVSGLGLGLVFRLRLGLGLGLGLGLRLG